MAKNVDTNLVKLAVDTYKGRPEKYSVEESMETLRNAMIDINGGTQFGYKDMRNAQYNGLFALVEEIIPHIVVDGLVGDEFFMRMVDFRNVAEGDLATFEVEDVNWFEIGEVAHGSRGLRRQRVGGKNIVTVPTKLHGVRIYEPLRRLLAKRTDFNQFIGRVAESYRQNILNDIYTFYSGLTATEMGSTYFPNNVAGSYSESATLDVVEHVEAASGKSPVIMGTAKALRNLAPSIQGVESKSDLYNLGYFGKYYGYDVVKLPQRHKIGTNTFIFDDDLHIIGADDKPIKFVYEGNSIIKMTDAMDNADMTQEYEFYDAYGMGYAAANQGGHARILLS